MNKLLISLRAHCKQLKTQRLRIKSNTRFVINVMHKQKQLCIDLLGHEEWELAKEADKEVNKCIKQLKSLGELDAFFLYQQKRIGQIIIEINAYPKYGVHMVREAADTAKFQQRAFNALITPPGSSIMAQYEFGEM